MRTQFVLRINHHHHHHTTTTYHCEYDETRVSEPDRERDREREEVLAPAHASPQTLDIRIVSISIVSQFGNMYRQ
jgi:hypothetical protein